MVGRVGSAGLAASCVPRRDGWSRQYRLGGSADRGGWWVRYADVQLGPGAPPGPVPWEVQHQPSCRGRDSTGDLNERATYGRGGRSGQIRRGQGGGGAGEVERDRREHEPGGI